MSGDTTANAPKNTFVGRAGLAPCREGAGTPALVANVPGTSYTPATLAGSTAYSWHVVARDSGGPGPTSGAWTFTTEPLAITGLSTASGAAGTLVTITGSGFGATQGGSTVTFNGVPAATAYRWSDTSITVLVPSGASTGNIVVTVGGSPSNGVNFTVTAVPSISGVFPNSAAQGAQVTVSGSGFGSAQGMGTVLLGSAYAAVVSWSDTQIVATVALNAASGNAQVQQVGIWSNAVPFSVSTATISGIAPSVGVPGTQVTVSGSGFGAAQGSGQVWLGTAPGIVQSWSDGAVVAQVTAGSATGSARVVQNGVMSNAVPFTVDALQITGLSPASGPPGTSVTISGSGFGSAQGSGIVLLGSAAGQVTGWSDTAITATVASTAVSGVARVEQNGLWSNALTFTVPASGGNSVTPSPNLITMLVGDTHTIQALNSSGQPVTGLTWTSSDPTVVSLSTSDPPLLTALVVGHVTITAGTGSADVTVSPGDPNYPGTLPLGTVLWSVPGDVTKIVPAVPSPSGVADVFAFQCENFDPSQSPSCWGDVTVQAITSDGTTAWTADLGDANPILPDFLGGLVYVDTDTGSISRVDGTTGQISTLYSPPNQTFVQNIAVHPDGTVFATLQNYSNDPVLNSVIGIDPTTGAQKFSVPVPQGLASNVAGLMIAGDGYAYAPYYYSFCLGPCIGQVTHVALLRIDTSGDYDNIAILDQPGGLGGDSSGGVLVQMITNADQGILFTVQGSGLGAGTGFVMAVTTGLGVSLTNAPVVVGDSYDSYCDGCSFFAAVQPVLQAQDGSFIGTVAVAYDNNNPLTDMASFDQTGAIRWMVPGNYQPQIATADGGLIATDPSGAAYTFDQNGNATGVLQGSPVQSFYAETYVSGGGGISDVVLPAFEWASGFQSQAGGNPSGNGTSVGVFESVESLPAWVLNFYSPPCQPPPPGGGVKATLVGAAATQYYNEVEQWLNGNYLVNPTCSAFLSNIQNYSVLYGGAISLVPSLLPIPYDGPNSNISLYDAGFERAEDLSTPQAVDAAKRAPVCGTFVPFNGPNGRHRPEGVVTAASQVNPARGTVATDVYINSNPKALKHLSQATIVHEALHNLTGMYDGPLESALGIPAAKCTNGRTVCITEAVRNARCAGAN